ncbi:MAG TPA: NAD(P)-dependent oxidoreductase [Nitrososphaerales archaeon]|nr:NAD(P)-dependent oxidoreductase [Nitrososphaerales archaeon]
MIQLTRTQEKILPPEERVENFDEIVKSYSEEEAVLEASRCVLCQDAPCVKACPTTIDIPRFIDRIRLRDFEGAINVIRLTNNLPNVCARVCPVEVLCEGSCVWHEKAGPVSIGLLQRFAADYQIEKMGLPVFQDAPKTAGRVAVVGGGPAGLGVAADLAKMNYDVTVFEERSDVGGLVRNGIMTTRLPTMVAQFDIEYIRRLGVKFATGKRIEDLDALLSSGFDAVFLGTGMRIPKKLGILGEDEFEGVIPALPLIEDVIDRVARGSELPSYEGKLVVVIGGGDTAMDAVSTALRLGAEKVSVVYRRSLEEMPAYSVEIKFAQEEKVEFYLESMPVSILGEKGAVTAVECVKLSPGLKPLGGTEFTIRADIVLVAVGQQPNSKLLSKMGLNLNGNGAIAVDEMFRTSKEGVFAGGDATNVHGRATVVKALGDSRVAARQIHEYVSKKKRKDGS